MPGTIEDAKIAIMNSSPESVVMLGTDSIRRRKSKDRWYATYSTVVILHHDGNHGAALYELRTEMDDFPLPNGKPNVKQRMLNEVMLTVQVGLDIVEAIGKRKFHIDIDINSDERHKSQAALREARGYIVGTFGQEPRWKPHGIAATHGADHLVRR